MNIKLFKWLSVEIGDNSLVKITEIISKHGVLITVIHVIGALVIVLLSRF